MTRPIRPQHRGRQKGQPMAELPQFSERSLLARQVVSVSRLPSLLLDTSHHVVAASQSFCVSFRIDPTQITQQSLADIGSGQWDLPQLEALLDRAMNGGPEVGPYEMPFQQADAEPRWLRVSADKIAGRGADEDLVMLSIEDITSVKLIADLRETLMREQNKFVYEKNKMTREKNLLLEEMRHRIANSLQIIASILIVKARSVQSAETRRHLTDAHDRVLSIAAIQDQLREGVTTVEVGPYLK
ncbi:MAG: hypothetical protein K2Y29_05905 [Beijerinckiaceae bacterium]|nr:hypothetical protein [Beijerinckiaceae bacterium]